MHPQEMNQIRAAATLVASVAAWPLHSFGRLAAAHNGVLWTRRWNNGARDLVFRVWEIGSRP